MNFEAMTRAAKLSRLTIFSVLPYDRKAILANHNK